MNGPRNRVVRVVMGLKGGQESLPVLFTLLFDGYDGCWGRRTTPIKMLSMSHRGLMFWELSQVVYIPGCEWDPSVPSSFIVEDGK